MSGLSGRPAVQTLLVWTGAKMPRRWRAVSAAAFGIALLGFGGGVTSASATTAPTVLNRVRVVLTSTSIEIPRDQFVKANGETRYPRGASIVFSLFNESKTTLSIELAVAGSKSVVRVPVLKLSGVMSAGSPIPPAHVRNFRVSFDFRGTFVMKELAHGKVVASRPIVIF
jgi:hypothetical protein